MLKPDNSRQTRWMIIAGVIAVVAVGTGVALRMNQQRKLAAWTADQAVPTVTVIHPKAADASDVLRLPATLQALNTAPIYARTSGYVRSWAVDIGQTVREGQVLAILDAPEVEQQLIAARAELQTAQANRQLAATTAERWNAMVAKDAVSRQAADEKLGDLAARTAAADAARANVARLEALMGFTRLVAPFDGVVTTRNAQIGALVAAGAAGSPPLFTVSDVSRIRAFVRVPQLYAARVKPGQQVALNLPEYPGRDFTALVTRDAGAVEPSSGTVLVELQAANADRALKPGAFAQAEFTITGAASAVTLPPSALIIGADGAQVALRGANGRAVLRKVSIGRDHGATVEIAAGLTAKDDVIDNPPEALQDGDPVRLAKSAEQ
ncbi:efflux RND transporter periplasmic adaptor subunit [Caulobacter segnis]|uniref:efflux RND transporter periplasmic adaptor subunit n=1 Tax=Caulobacter segnis TaxID=88688 RepID=UPI00240F0452|nr:efflux RND transporter periplasmic adaptor subunit [Caulobacter segnis]MDG2522118.1 efflux RND transporter periplasmic adaptor subunit [Caulobacter segnis]